MVGIARIGQAAGTAGALPIVAYDYSNGITRTFTASSAESTAVSAQVVRLIATQNVYYKIGPTPQTAAADGTSNLLPAWTVEHVKINSGDVIAALREAADGTLFITPCEEA